MSKKKGMKHGGMGHGHGHMGMGQEKAKDFKGTMKKLIEYLSPYKLAILLVVAFAIGSSVFNIAGPKILGNATTEIFNGLVNKVSNSGSGIDFDSILKTLIELKEVNGIKILINGEENSSFPDGALNLNKIFYIKYFI